AGAARLRRRRCSDERLGSDRVWNVQIATVFAQCRGSVAQALSFVLCVECYAVAGTNRPPSSLRSSPRKGDATTCSERSVASSDEPKACARELTVASSCTLFGASGESKVR